MLYSHINLQLEISTSTSTRKLPLHLSTWKTHPFRAMRQIQKSTLWIRNLSIRWQVNWECRLKRNPEILKEQKGLLQYAREFGTTRNYWEISEFKMKNQVEKRVEGSEFSSWNVKKRSNNERRVSITRNQVSFQVDDSRWNFKLRFQVEESSWKLPMYIES